MFKKIIQNIIKSFLAGMLIGLAGFMFLMAKYKEFDVLPALLFPVGLFLICTFSLNLYTGKIGFVFDKEKNIKILDLLIMVIFNFVGALSIGLLFRLMYSQYPMVSLAEAIAKSKFKNLEFVTILLVFIKSTICGMFVYIAVVLFGKSQNECAKVLGVWIPIFTFAYLGLDHSIANMFYMSAGNYYNVTSFVLILVAIVGNSVGAILFDLVKRKVL